MQPCVLSRSVVLCPFVLLLDFFQLFGAVVFLSHLDSVKDDSTQASMYGLVAGIFSLIASLSCCCSVICCSIVLCDEDGHGIIIIC